MVAAKLANMAQGERTDIQPFANLQKVSQSEAASLLNVSSRSVATMAKLPKNRTKGTALILRRYMVGLGMPVLAGDDLDRQLLEGGGWSGRRRGRDRGPGRGRGRYRAGFRLGKEMAQRD